MLVYGEAIKGLQPAAVVDDLPVRLERQDGFLRGGVSCEAEACRVIAGRTDRGV